MRIDVRPAVLEGLFIAIVQSEINKDHAIRGQFDTEASAQKWANTVARRMENNIRRIREEAGIIHQFELAPYVKEDA